MKNAYLLSPFALVIGAYVWMSASSGVADVQNQDRTGSPVSAQACNMCHQGNNFSISTNLQLIDQNGDTVNEYQPNTLYTLTATINAPGASHFGFQITGVDAANNGIGGWTPITTGTKKVTLNNRPYFEQMSPLATNEFECEWLSPDPGTGTVTFYGSALGVNGDGGISGDAFTSFNDLVITEASGLSVVEVSNDGFDLYPIPAQHQITVNTSKKVNRIAVYSLTGKLAIDYSSPGVLDISALDRGTYLMQVTFADESSDFKRFVKE